MFDAEQLKSIDSRYFNIITMDEYDVTIQSRNTGHYWYLHSTGVPSNNACVIFHKHKFSHPYHQHGHGNSLRQAIRSIQSDTKILFPPNMCGEKCHIKRHIGL